MSIVGGFFGKLSEDITDKKQYIRARVEEDRTYLRQQGLKRQSGIQQQRSNYEDAANMLVRRGADRSQVLGLLSSDPKGLMEVYKTDFTGEQLRTSFILAEDYKNESTMSEILSKIVPTIQAMPKDSSPDKIKRKSLGAYLGLDLDTELNDQVYSQDIVGGMTGDDILGSIGSPIESKGSNPDGVTYNFDRKQNTALTSSQVNGLFDTANSDYSESDIADYIKNIDTIVKIEPGETPEAFKDRKARLSDTAMDFGKATGLDRLAIGIELFGVRENTQSVYNEYGARLFSATNGVNKNLLSMLGASGKDNQTIIDEVSSVFETNPDLLEHTIEIDGKPVTFTREDYEAEKAGSSFDPETPDVSSSPRPKSRPRTTPLAPPLEGVSDNPLDPNYLSPAEKKKGLAVRQERVDVEFKARKEQDQKDKEARAKDISNLSKAEAKVLASERDAISKEVKAVYGPIARINILIDKKLTGNQVQALRRQDPILWNPLLDAAGYGEYSENQTNLDSKPSASQEEIDAIIAAASKSLGANSKSNELEERIKAYEKKYNPRTVREGLQTASEPRIPKVRSSLASKRGN